MKMVFSIWNNIVVFATSAMIAFGGFVYLLCIHGYPRPQGASSHHAVTTKVGVTHWSGLIMQGYEYNNFAAHESFSHSLSWLKNTDSLDSHGLATLYKILRWSLFTFNLSLEGTWNWSLEWQKDRGSSLHSGHFKLVHALYVHTTDWWHASFLIYRGSRL